MKFFNFVFKKDYFEFSDYFISISLQRKGSKFHHHHETIIIHIVNNFFPSRFLAQKIQDALVEYEINRGEYCMNFLTINITTL